MNLLKCIKIKYYQKQLHFVYQFSMQSLLSKRHKLLKLIFIFSITPIFTFKTLEDARKYLSQLPSENSIEKESVPSIQELNPLYRKFYLKTQPSFYKKLGYRLKLISQPLWSISDFKELLQETTLARENNGFYENYTLALNIKKKARCIIVSNIRGCFYSLIRILNWLEINKIINNDFTFTDNNTFFIFNGNTIDGDPFNLETLYTILLLLNKSPNNVFYIKGTEENDNQWQNHNLKEELIVRARAIDPSSRLPLENMTNRFFLTLPAAIYITNNDPDLKRITIKSLPDNQLSKKQWQVCTFDNNKEKVLLQCKHRSECTSLHITKSKNRNLREVTISPENRLISYKYNSGLTQINPNLWYLVSSPTAVYKKHYKFFYDAVVLLYLDTELLNSTISLFNNFSSTPEKFIHKVTYNLFTGQIKYDIEKMLKLGIQKSEFNPLNSNFRF